MDCALIRILEWLERFRAHRIYLSASVVRIRDEHNHIDSNTTFLDLQEGNDGAGRQASAAIAPIIAEIDTAVGCR